MAMQMNTFGNPFRTSGRIHSVFQSVYSKYYSTQSETEIVIPNRIHRSPTDILKALSKTVNRDPTAPHYKYHDDPFLIPASNYAKRSFALAQESGRKAAKWILQEHADLFQHRVADPFIEVFAPKQIITEESDVTIESLNKALSSFDVSDAITIYNVLQKNNFELSKEKLQGLLELVCFYNGEDKMDEEWIEERWFKQGVKDKGYIRKTWKDGGVAESIFLSIDPPDSKSFSTLIIGMASYGQLDQAWKYFEEAKSKGIQLNTDVYNILIKNVASVKEQFDARWNLVQDLLKEIKANKLSPNIKTLNAILEAISGMSNSRNSKNYALAAFAEFRKLGIDPSLASYYYLLKIHCSDRTRTSGILIDIMNVLEGKSFTIQDQKDTFFFVTAMEICNTYMSDMDLANRVNNLLLTGDNYNLIGDSYKESIYLRNYFILKCQYEPVEDFMKFYELYVPHIYVPEPAVMEYILNAIDMNGASKYLPQLWSDMILFDHITRENLVTLLIDILYKNPAAENEELGYKLADVAEDIYRKIEDMNVETGYTKKNTISWTGNMLGQLMAVLLNADRFEKSCEILEKLDKEQQKILGVPDVRPMTVFIEKTIQRNDANKAIWCLQYCYDVGYEETNNLGKSVYSKLKLDEVQKSRLKTIVNIDEVTEIAN